jgi:ABC-type multidrug transport system fused ATPase/permease subunit
MLTKLLSYLGPNLWNIGWVLLQVLLIAGFELLKPWPLQVVIDNLLGNSPFPIAGLSSSRAGLLLLVCTAIVFVQFGAGALTLLHNYTAIRIGQNMVKTCAAPSMATSSDRRLPSTAGNEWAISCIGSPRTVSRSRL